MKKIVFATFFSLSSAVLCAQESETAYNFLRLPVSAHAAALGGDNVSITDDDASMAFHNPALLSGVADKTINLNFMTYMEGAKTASASFTKALRERATWFVGAQYIDYGEMKHTTSSGEILGNISAKDIMLCGALEYNLTNRLSGGITAKFITSDLAGYNSLAVGLDLGLNYYDYDHDLSISAVARNLGGQVKAYEDNFERMPIDVQLGVTKRILDSPIRLSLTMTRLNDWSSRFANHFVVGADILLSESIYIAGGYNFRRADEMKISDTEGSSSHGAALSFGAGLQLQRFKLQLAYGKYHVSASSININLSYGL
ncbi:MAG: type IX secretion system protein PorQ [Prevotella sp.]